MTDAERDVDELQGGDWTSGRTALRASACRRCGHRWYLPHRLCPACGAHDTERFDIDGTGTVAAVTVVHRRSGGGPPIGIALVDLTAGVRVMARCSAAAVVGQATTVRIAAIDGAAQLPVCDETP